MNRRIIQLSNLIEAIENGMITITNVENKVKASIDIIETYDVTPFEFLESIRKLNESTLFGNGIDFFYEFTGNKGLCIECGMKNRYMDEFFCVECVIQDDYSEDDIDAKLRESVLDKLGEKIAV